MISPKLEVLAQELKDIVIIKVDVDENEVMHEYCQRYSRFTNAFPFRCVIQDIATEYKVTAMPTFIFIKNGAKIDEFAGANEAKLKELINKLK